MGRRRSTALRDAAGAHHVASRLSHAGFRATVEHAARGGAGVLVGLPGGSGYVAIAVRTTECPEGFGDEGVVCEWRVGKEFALAGDPGPLVALVDLGGAGWLPRAWVVPSGEARRHLASAGEGRPYRYRASAEELVPREEDWDAVEDHLGRRTAWFERGELEESYGEEFVEALDFEASRLLGAHNSITRRMADERFPAEDLADAQALLRVLFRRYMQEQRDRRFEENQRRKREGRT
jgi:hypothetical protein